MKNKLTFMTFILVSIANTLVSKSGDETDTTHPYHPIVQDAKLIASFAKIWWIAEKMEKHAHGDHQQQNLLERVKDNAHDMKEMLIKALTQRINEQAGNYDQKNTVVEEEMELID